MALLDFVALIIIVIVAVVVVNYLTGSRQEKSEPGWQKPVAVDWSAINDSELQRFIAAGQKINAIKRYRELTGEGLKEAKDAVEYASANPGGAASKKKTAYDTPDAGIRDLVRDGEIDRAVEVYRVFAGVDEYTARDAIRQIERELRLGDEPAPVNQAHILELLRQDKKIEAIKVYRETTGLGLKEAKDAVEAIERGMLP
jgi:ribosomal protein L7/L12